MPWPDFFGRRKLHEEIAGLALEVAAIRELLADDLRKADETLELVQNPKPERVGAGRLVRLSWFCVICIIWAGIAAEFALPVFADPAPNYNNLGWIRAAVETSASNSGKYINQPSVSIETLVGEDRHGVTDVVVFPRSYVGKRFVILLAGSAVIGEPESDTSVRVEDGPCSAIEFDPLSWEADSRSATDCQAIFGVVPPESAPDPNEGCAQQSPGLNPDGVRVSVGGNSTSTARLDLVHYQTTLPDDHNYDNSASETFFGLDLHGTYALLEQDGGCKAFDFPSNRIVSTMSPK